MKSIAATELAKLGKCEGLVPRARGRASAKRNNPSDVVAFSSASANTAAIERGVAAHDEYEREVQFFMSKDCHTSTKATGIALALAVTVGILTLLAAVVA
jgi:hypothetical protein